MRIGICTRFLLNSKMEGFGWFTHETVSRIVKAHPEHEFVFFFDREFDTKFIYAENVKPIVLFPMARHAFLFIWFYEWSLKRALKREKIDLFLGPDGFLSLRSKVPQINVIHDLNFEYNPKDIPFFSRHYLRYFFPRFAKKAKQIVTVSEYSKQDIVKSYGINPGKITVAWNGASSLFVPISEDKKTLIRNQFSKGKKYFIFVGALHKRKNLPSLLKAFQKFSERNGEVDLLIVGAPLFGNTSIEIPDLNDEQKSRVHFTGHLSIEELTKVMASAFALTYFSSFEGFGIPLVEAMKCGIPVLCGDQTSLPEVVGDSALMCEPKDVDSISDLMLKVTENAELYTSLCDKSLERAKLFSWDFTADKIWKVIEFELEKIKYS